MWTTSWTINVTTTGVSDIPQHRPNENTAVCYKLQHMQMLVLVADIKNSTCHKIHKAMILLSSPSTDSSLSISLQAIDADLGSNLTYRVRTEDSDQEIAQLFHIDPVTGELSVLKILDYEALADSEPTYTFTVEATDTEGTMPPGRASVTVRIMVSAWVGVYELVCLSKHKSELNLSVLQFSVFSV